MRICVLLVQALCVSSKHRNHTQGNMPFALDVSKSTTVSYTIRLFGSGVEYCHISVTTYKFVCLKSGQCQNRRVLVLPFDEIIKIP